MTLFVISFLIFLVWYDINPSGQRKVNHSYSQTNNLVKGPYPVERLVKEKKTAKNYWEVIIDPVYFDLYIPRLYQHIYFTLIFKLTNEKTVIELGGVGSNQGWQVTLKPAYNGFLESLNLNCQVFPDDFAQLSVCAGRKSLPGGLKSPYEIFEIYPEAEYVNYFFPLANHLDSIGSLSNLNIKKWDNSFNLSDFDFLVTSYVPAEDFGNGWKKATAIFSPEELWLNDHIYKFILSIPNLSKTNDTIKVQAVEFYLEKEPINKQNFQEKLGRFWQRFKSRF